MESATTYNERKEVRGKSRADFKGQSEIPISLHYYSFLSYLFLSWWIISPPTELLKSKLKLHSLMAAPHPNHISDDEQACFSEAHWAHLHPHLTHHLTLLDHSPDWHPQLPSCFICSLQSLTEQNNLLKENLKSCHIPPQIPPPWFPVLCGMTHSLLSQFAKPSMLPGPASLCPPFLLPSPEEPPFGYMLGLCLAVLLPRMALLCLPMATSSAEESFSLGSCPITLPDFNSFWGEHLSLCRRYHFHALILSSPMSDKLTEKRKLVYLTHHWITSPIQEIFFD